MIRGSKRRAMFRTQNFPFIAISSSYHPTAHRSSSFIAISPLKQLNTQPTIPPSHHPIIDMGSVLTKLKHAKTKTPTASTASFHPGPVIDGPAAPFFEAPAPEAPMVQAPVDEAPAIDAFNPDAANTGDEEGVWFTTLEDHALVGMKLQNMGWAEISDAMPDKGVEFLKLRYLELYEAAHDNIENGGEGSSKRKETPLKGILKNKSRVHIQANPDSNDDSDGSSCDSFIDPAPPPFSPMYQAPQIVIEANEVSLSALSISLIFSHTLR